MDQYRQLRSAVFVCLLFSAAAMVAAQVTDQELLNPDPNDWLLYSGTYNSQRHSLLKQITTGNVATMQAKWVFHMFGAKDLEAVPIVYKGVMYVAQYNRVHALDAATGRVIWEWQRQLRPADERDFLGHRPAVARLCRRQPRGRQPVFGQHRRARPRYGQAEMALPEHAARRARLGFDGDAGVGRHRVSGPAAQAAP